MSAQDIEPVAVSAAAEYYDLGPFCRLVSTKNSHAQIWFNRGLVWAYSFNHGEAVRCFEQVVAHDPSCAMGYWGIAFASGPNYNKKWANFDEKDLKLSVLKCHLMALKAKEHITDASPVEQGLIDAIQHRFPTRIPPDDFSPSTLAYANAMKQVYKDFGDDLDVVALAADALMNTNPRNLFNKRSGQPILSTPVLEIKNILERSLRYPNSRNHPGILHMYIHLMEMSTTPEAAINAADLLRNLVPDAGHIHHMPSHIDVLVGDYRKAIDTNMKATIADDKYFAKEGGLDFYSLYRLHDYHSLIYAAMMAGQSRIALESVGRLEATLSEDLLLVDSPPMADWMEFFKSIRIHVFIRFGMWEELKREPVPENKELYCTTVAITHYGKAIAWAATRSVVEADRERELFRAAAERVPPTRLVFPNRAASVLEVAAAMLDGEIEYRRGNYELAFENLRLAIARDDALEYSEPWGWMLPTRHSYAALQLEQGHVEEAATAYAEDLGLNEGLVRAHQHPNNVWALHGYHESLVLLGRTDEAKIIEKQLTIAAAGADVLVSSSCFCRFKTRKVSEKTCGGCSE
ncbi:tpr domain protein [Colletotrichum incanum]|uniref:Tpr domain protein n=1 Tax=Colletotrichum incanum TaxID=1573173 RepID=A0A162PK88_COLIC|nr:tpr domain protein [Colletotrichum incanum]